MTEKGKTAIAILDLFEDMLEKNNIEIPCEYKQEQTERHDGGNTAKIYGSEYFELEAKISELL